MKAVYRTITRKAERQNGKPFDVLACGHAVPVDASTHANTYRKARSCPECSRKVAEYAALHARQSTRTAS